MSTFDPRPQTIIGFDPAVPGKDMTIVIKQPTRADIEEIARSIAMKTPLLARMPKTPATGIVHTWNPTVGVDSGLPFGTIIRYPPTGEYAMVVAKSAMSAYLRTISLGGSISGYEAGDVMDIAQFAWGEWRVEKAP